MENHYYRGRACCYSFTISMPLLFTYIANQLISLLLYSTDYKSQRIYYDVMYFVGPIMEAIGALLSIKIIKYGRRRTTMLMSAVISFFSFLAFLPFQNLAYHLIIKLLLGLPLGFFGVQVLYFIYEIAPSSERGWMIGVSNFTYSLGFLYSNSLNYLVISDGDWFTEQNDILIFKDQDIATKTIVSFTIYYIPLLLPWLVIFLFSCIYERETPTFLLESKRFGEVKPALSEIYRNVSIEEKINDIISEQSFSSRQKTKCLTRAQLKAFVVCLVVCALVQMSGYHAISVNLAQQNSPNNLGMGTFAVLANVVQLLGSLTFILFLSQIARKILLVGGLLLLTSCEASIICFTLNPSDQTASFTVFVSLVFLFIYGISVRNIGYLIIVEMLDYKLGAITIAFSYLFTVIVESIQLATRTVYNLENINNLTLIYCAFNVIGIFIVIFLMNESNQKRRDQVLTRQTKRESSDSMLEPMGRGIREG